MTLRKPFPHRVLATLSAFFLCGLTLAAQQTQHPAATSQTAVGGAATSPKSPCDTRIVLRSGVKYNGQAIGEDTSQRANVNSEEEWRAARDAQMAQETGKHPSTTPSAAPQSQTSAAQGRMAEIARQVPGVDDLLTGLRGFGRHQKPKEQPPVATNSTAPPSAAPCQSAPMILPPGKSEAAYAGVGMAQGILSNGNIVSLGWGYNGVGESMVRIRQATPTGLSVGSEGTGNIVGATKDGGLILYTGSETDDPITNNFILITGNPTKDPSGKDVYPVKVLGQFVGAAYDQFVKDNQLNVEVATHPLTKPVSR